MFDKWIQWLLAMTVSYGSWESPITSDSVVSQSISFREMQTDGERLYWLEGRPSEEGRVALIAFDGRSERELLPGKSVRTKVHEYGGGAFFAGKKELLYSNQADGQLYTLKGKKLTSDRKMRYADGSSRIWVAESHGKKVENLLVYVGDSGVKKLATGHDFYSCPRLSPDGKKLAFITWDFPHMQWDSSTLWIADFTEEQELENLQPIAGGPDESVCQVQWSPDGVLHFVSDRTGFWNLYTFQEGEVENICEMDAEFGIPSWVFGQPTYAFLPDSSIICSYVVKGVDHLGKINPKTKTLLDLNQPYTCITNLVSIGNTVYFVGASQTEASSIIAYDTIKGRCKRIKPSTSMPLPKEWISEGEILEYPSGDQEIGYAFYYPPTNPHCTAPEGELPPVIIDVHGGPTGRSYMQLNPKVQYFTSRGFAVVNVNYSGSTGYGRKYFQRLNKNWGLRDVEDCISAAKTLVERGLADPTKLIIRGGSAGGYTALAALAFHNVFSAGVSAYGIGDLELLYTDDHKFESKYTDQLVASFPEEVEEIRRRSPIHAADQIGAPVLLLQGEEDTVVPPNQAHAIYNALLENRVPVGMLLFPGEGHGFRKAKTAKQALDAELYFYSEILGFELPQPFEAPPVSIIWR